MANDEDSAKAWHHRLTTLVGQRIKHIRESGDRKTTVGELADRCEELGHRVEPQLIHNMEAKRRSNVTIAELLVLAAALEVPLALLLTPLGSSAHMELLPGKSTDPWTAYQWLVGELPTEELAKPPRLDVTWFKPPVVNAYRQHEIGLRAYLAGHSKGLAKIVGARVEMQREGWWRPPLPADVAEALHPVLMAYGWREDTSGELHRVQPETDLADLDELAPGAP